MSGFRKNRPLRPFTWLLLLGAVAFAAGCSTANTSGGGGTSTSHILPNGTSVAGWTNPAGGSLHASAATNEYVSNGALVSCTECHGARLRGGTGEPKGPSLAIVAGYSEQDFATPVRSSVALGGRTLDHMKEMALLHFSHLTDAEIHALHSYLKRLVAEQVS